MCLSYLGQIVITEKCIAIISDRHAYHALHAVWNIIKITNGEQL